uniref:Cyclic nucleotide-binding domain-containing protein n=1 Tax=Alexandrium monilatum TaxID=311494 RepID=A0A7S4V6V1_9DINO
MAAAGLRARMTAAAGLATAAAAPWGRSPAGADSPRSTRPTAAHPRRIAPWATQLPLVPVAARRLTECKGLPRTTTLRELDHIHEEDFTLEMRTIAGQVDFRSMLQEGSFVFQGVDSQVIERLVFGQKVFARRGTVLIEEGQENSAVFVVGHGSLSVHVGETHVAAVGPGQVIGLMAMFKKSAATATVRVESDVAYLLVLRYGHFMACLDDDPEVHKRLQLLVHQRELQNATAEMLSKNDS